VRSPRPAIETVDDWSLGSRLDSRSTSRCRWAGERRHRVRWHDHQVNDEGARFEVVTTARLSFELDVTSGAAAAMRDRAADSRRAGARLLPSGCARRGFRPNRVAVHDDGERATGKMSWVRRPFQLERPRFSRGLSMSRRWVGVATIGAHEAVHHQFQRSLVDGSATAVRDEPGGRLSRSIRTSFGELRYRRSERARPIRPRPARAHPRCAGRNARSPRA
jgi:hypothetical protein